ncbi:MAG: hypothetical protein ACI9WS_002083 [Paraglaciecola psychrophila]|jgi:hypothetical protein
MVNMPPIYHANINTVSRIQRNKVQAAVGTPGQSINPGDRRNMLDRRRAKSAAKLMDRRIGAKRRRPSVNLSV